MIKTLRSSTLSGSFSVLVILGFSILTGCGKKPEAPPEPAVQPMSIPRPVVHLPPRTPGLWEMTVTEEGSAESPQVVDICIDAQTDGRLGLLGTDLSGSRCQKTVNGNAEDGWGVIAACDMGNDVTSEVSGSISGDYATDYTMKLRSQTINAAMPQMNRVAKYSVVAKRQGDCPADQSPGDVVNDGVRFNLYDMEGVSRSDAAVSDAPMH